MDKLLTLPEVAEVTRLSEATLRWLRHNGTGPRSGKLGRRIFYREQDVIAWVTAQFDADRSGMTAPPPGCARTASPNLRANGDRTDQAPDPARRFGGDAA